MDESSATPPPARNKGAAGGRPRPPLRRRGSLRRRLPLVMSLFLVATVAAGGFAAYITVREAVIAAAAGRLQSSARQWGRLLAQSTAQRNEEARRAAAHPALRAGLRPTDPAAATAAQRQVEALLRSSPQLLSVELWDPSGTRVASAVAGVGPEGPGLPATHASERPRSPGSRPLLASGPLLYSELGVEVPAVADGRADALPGMLVFRRRLPTPAAAQAINRLISDGCSIRLGSRQSGIWTNLEKRVDAPPVTKGAEVVQYRRADGSDWRGTELALTGLPWSLWIEMPESAALAPAHAFLKGMLPVGTGFVLLGGLLAWVISRRITAPLHELTGAVEAIAAGDFSQRVHADRTDEVGQLADAFNTMADEVQAGYARLDTGIRVRTAELEQAVSALNDAQEQLVRREKLAMLGQLASGVGHELRNPLGVMTNAVYYLEMVQADAPAEVQEYHGILRAQIGLAEKIVGDLLDFSRIKPPQRDVVALADLVAAQRVRLTVPEGITIDVRVPVDVPRVHIDVVQIGQVVFNLLMNALQVLEERGGTITIDCTVSDRFLALHVQDDGPGVAAGLRAKIFEPLFTTKARGIGLGLAVSRNLAEVNDGELVLDDVASGACFTLRLPFDSVKETAA